MTDVEKLARQIMARETSYEWDEAPEEVREDCRESAAGMLCKPVERV